MKKNVMNNIKNNGNTFLLQSGGVLFVKYTEMVGFK